jgi:hypothetical protein
MTALKVEPKAILKTLALARLTQRPSPDTTCSVTSFLNPLVDAFTEPHTQGDPPSVVEPAA